MILMRTCIELLDGGSHVRWEKDRSDVVEFSSDLVTGSVIEKIRASSIMHVKIELMQPLIKDISSHSGV